MDAESTDPLMVGFPDDGEINVEVTDRTRTEESARAYAIDAFGGTPDEWVLYERRWLLYDPSAREWSRTYEGDPGAREFFFFTWPDGPLYPEDAGWEPPA